MYFSVKKLIHHPRKRLYNLIKTCNIKKKEGKKKEKECRSHASFKEAEFNDKVEDKVPGSVLGRGFRVSDGISLRMATESLHS